MEDSQKRKRSDSRNWRLLIPDASSLRTVVEAVTTVIPRVVFRVVPCGEGSYAVCVDGRDPGYTCCVSAKIVVDEMQFGDDGATEDRQVSFCLDCKQVLYSIESPSCSHVSLTVASLVEESKVSLSWCDPEHPAHQENSKLSVFVDEEVDELKDMDFEFTINIILVKLREMLRKAPKARAEHVRFRLYVDPTAAVAAPRSVFEISISGETEHCQRFCQLLVRDDDNSFSVHTSHESSVEAFDHEDFDLAFEGVYPVEKLNAFVKVVPTRTLVARAKNHMPLLLTLKLGPVDDASQVHFLVAPIVEE